MDKTFTKMQLKRHKTHKGTLSVELASQYTRTASQSIFKNLDVLSFFIGRYLLGHCCSTVSELSAQKKINKVRRN